MKALFLNDKYSDKNHVSIKFLSRSKEIIFDTFVIFNNFKKEK